MYGISDKISEQFSERNINAEAPDHLTDVTLCVEGTSIHVHRLILSIQSRYFKKMCEAELTKSMSTGNVIEIWATSMACSLKSLAHNSVIFMARNWKEMIRDGKIQEEENFVQLNNTICFLHSEEM